MLLERHLPRYDLRERHFIHIDAPAERVWRALWELDWGQSGAVRWLLKLRGLALRQLNQPRFTIRDMERAGFRLLETEPPEVVFGLVGRFWTPTGGLVRGTPGDFATFDRPGFAKAAGNYLLQELTPGRTRVYTETRIQCLGEKARRRFGMYWGLIGPFSAFTRREALRLLKKKAEAA